MILFHVDVSVICRDEEGQILILKDVWNVSFHTYGKPCKNSTLRMTTAVHLRIRELGVFFFFFKQCQLE